MQKRNNKQKIKYLKTEEWNKIISIVDNFRERLILKFLYFSGMRVGEFAKIKVQDIDFKIIVRYNYWVRIYEIRDAFIKKQFRYTKHGLEQKINRRIYSQEIEEVILSGEIIEEYSVDKYGPRR